MPQSSTINTRRDFLRNLGATTLGTAVFLSSVALDTEAGAAQLPGTEAVPGAKVERDVPFKTATERMAALEKIEKITDRSSEADDRKVQAVEIKQLVADYIASMEGASDFTIKELEKAKSVNYGDINMLHFSNNLGDAAADFVNTVALPFYEAQVPVLRAFREENPDKTGEVNQILNTIRGDITWCRNHKLPEVAVRAAKSMSDLFMDDDDCNTLMVYRNLSQFDDPRFPLTVFLEKRELAEKLIKETLDDVSKGETDKGPEKVKALFEVHELLRNALEKCGEELLPQQQVQDLKRWLQEHVAIPVFEQIVPMYDVVYGKSQSNSSFDLHNHAAKLAQTIDNDLVKTSNRYVADLKQYCDSKPTDASFRLSAYRLLMHLAPDPATTSFIAEDLEELLVNKRNEKATPTEVVAGLGAILAAGYNHSLVAGATGNFNAAQSTDMVGALLDSSVAVNVVDPPLPPSHALLTKIFRAGTSGRVESGFPELAGTDQQVEDKVNEICFAITVEFIRGVSRACPRELYSSRESTNITRAPIPEAWGGPAIVARDPDNAEQASAFTDTMRHFYRLADIGAEKLADLTPEMKRQELIDRMVLVLDLADQFDFVGNKQTSEAIYREAQTSLPYLSPRTEDEGPFAHAFKRAQGILYQKALGQPAPPPLPDDPLLARNQRGRDEKLDNLALSYARVAEERFACDLVLTLMADDREKRPIGSHQTLSDNRMQGQLAAIANKLGFINRYVEDRRREYSSDNPAVSNLSTILTDAPGDEFQAATEARSKKLLEDQTALLKRIRETPRR